MSATKTIKWGILGLGKIAHKFASDLKTVSGCELQAVASRNQEKADEFAQIFQAKIAYDSYEKLAKDSEIEAIYIATPHSLHKELSILCLQHKKAVLCEKAFAMNYNEVSEMIQVAEENDTLLMEALWTRFLPHYQFVIDAVNSEKYGKIKQLEADFGFYTPYDLLNRVFRKELGEEVYWILEFIPFLWRCLPEEFLKKLRLKLRFLKMVLIHHVAWFFSMRMPKRI